MRNSAYAVYVLLTFFRVAMLFASVVLILYLIISCAPPRSPVVYARYDMRELGSAIELYYKANHRLPEAELMRYFTTEQETLVAAGGWNLETIHPGSTNIVGLTTPIAYIRDLPKDPFSAGDSVPYRYQRAGLMVFLSSAGPDRDYDLADINHYDRNGLTYREAMSDITYDPTNGTASSNGDLIHYVNVYPLADSPEN